MTQTAIATKIHQALDAHADFHGADHLQRQIWQLRHAACRFVLQTASLILTSSAIPAAARMALERVLPTP